MPNLVALGLVVSDKRFSKITNILSFVTMATRTFEGSNCFKNCEKDYGRNISVKFHQNWISSFREEDV